METASESEPPLGPKYAEAYIRLFYLTNVMCIRTFMPTLLRSKAVVMVRVTANTTHERFSCLNPSAVMAGCPDDVAAALSCVSARVATVNELRANLSRTAQGTYTHANGGYHLA